MTADSTPFNSVEPTQLFFELSIEAQQQAWRNVRAFSTPQARWNAYLNQLCLDAVLTELPENGLAAQLDLKFWEGTNGTAVRLNHQRLLLVPSEAIDNRELRVPQEWVDIPSWRADYYLAVQVHPDAGIRVWGYTTHQHLKTQGQYHNSDRTYSLDDTQLIADLSVFMVARQLCPTEPTQATVSPLPQLSLTQAENLLERLASPELLDPRLAVPFEWWAALIAHDGWRQRFTQRRQGLPEQWNIRQWLQQGVSRLAQQCGWERVEFQPALAGARGTEGMRAEAMAVRSLLIAGQPYELRILSQNLQNPNIWRFELHPGTLEGRIPGGFRLRLLTEDLQPFENNEDLALTAADLLFVDVALESGEGLVWEIEPLPENYQQEILRF